MLGDSHAQRALRCLQDTSECKYHLRASKIYTKHFNLLLRTPNKQFSWSTQRKKKPQQPCNEVSCLWPIGNRCPELHQSQSHSPCLNCLKQYGFDFIYSSLGILINETQQFFIDSCICCTLQKSVLPASHRWLTIWLKIIWFKY